MPILKSSFRRILSRVAKQVHKHDLFEQLNERQNQPPLAPSSQPSNDQLVPEEQPNSVPSLPAIGECVLGSTEEFEQLLNSLRHPIIINHWATWCDPCNEELPILALLSERLESAQLIGLSWEFFQDGWEGNSVVQKRINDLTVLHNIQWSNWIITDDPDTFFTVLGLDFKQIPQTWVILPSNSNRWEHHGVLTKKDIEIILNKV